MSLGLIKQMSGSTYCTSEFYSKCLEKKLFFKDEIKRLDQNDPTLYQHGATIWQIDFIVNKEIQSISSRNI